MKSSYLTDPAIKARFLSKVVVTPGGCHEWSGARQQHSKGGSSGYPKFRVGQRIVYAHRLALEYKLGRPLRQGYEADHMCHNIICVNDQHLRELTKRENVQDEHIYQWSIRKAPLAS